MWAILFYQHLGNWKWNVTSKGMYHSIPRKQLVCYQIAIPCKNSKTCMIWWFNPVCDDIVRYIAQYMNSSNTYTDYHYKGNLNESDLEE